MLKRVLRLTPIIRMKWTTPDLMDLPLGVASCSVFPTYFTDEILGEEWISSHRGPTRESNWLIPGSVLMSSHPHLKDVNHGMQRLFNIINEDVYTFVNLQTPSELSDWEIYPKSYISRLRDIQKRRRDDNDCFDLKFIYLEIEDREIPSCEEIRECVDEIIDELEKERNILIHCKGGKGRTGVVGACLLSDLYENLKLSEILQRIQSAHDTREFVNHHYSPQEYQQYFFIRDYVGEERNDMHDLEEQMINHFGDIS